MFVLGVAIELCFMRRLREQDRTAMSILVTYAVAIVIEGMLTAIFGVDYQQLQASYVNSSVHVLGFYLPYIYLIGFGLAVVLLGALYYMLYRTKFGRAVRASLQNRTAADLIGIDVNRMRTISVGIGVAVTAVGGMVFGATNAFNPNSGYDLISRLLAIVILGGMGSIGGAMAAAMFLLVINDVVAVAWSPTWAPLVFFAALWSWCCRSGPRGCSARRRCAPNERRRCAHGARDAARPARRAAAGPAPSAAAAGPRRLRGRACGIFPLRQVSATRRRPRSRSSR